ncbi:FAD:protein FMN transferase [Parapusillimonas sp. SGNA-6]|nr:FAD:protein FMN transferase [Parapusillimonas sp. SGNA-6]
MEQDGAEPAQGRPAALHRTTSASAPLQHVRLAGDTMGTQWSVLYPAVSVACPSDALAAHIRNALDDINRQMSTWDPQSVISRLNRAPRGWYQVPAELFHVLEHALSAASASAGMFDPTIGELVDLWGFGPAGPVTVPPQDEVIAQAVQRCGWRKLKLDAAHSAVWQPGGLQLDLSGIAKGYGVDRIARVLDESGVPSYLVEIGGELASRGRKADGTPWRVDIDIPDGPKMAAFPIILNDAALATSGDYRRCYVAQGRRHAHTISAFTGYPVANELASVSVVHSECMKADALATALLGMGLEQGLAHARRHGIPALFMHRQAQDLGLTWTDEFLGLAGRPDDGAPAY